jgi:hypothetical protein
MVILPKKKIINGVESYYLSYSQISSWLKYKKDYYSSYFYKVPFEGNAYTSFGSKIGEALESNSFDNFTEKEQQFLRTIPRGDEFEREINLLLPNGVYVTGYIDTNKLPVNWMRDYKTGAESKISEYNDPIKYLQIPLYAGAIQQETGIIPQDCGVVLIDRTGNAFRGEELLLGEKFWEIPLKIGEKEIKNAIETAVKVSEEISKEFQMFQRINKQSIV